MMIAGRCRGSSFRSRIRVRSSALLLDTGLVS